MDYENIHSTFINYCKKTKPKERLIQRNPFDNRLLAARNLYVEVHHITPKSLGGLNEKNNLVTLLPEEHLFIHKLRYKAFNTREDMLAVRFICNGLKNKGHIESYKNFRLTRHILATYAWVRSESANFRAEHGWQTESGRTRISEARKGTMPVKDNVTGEMIGSVDVAHPNVLAGKWVHHSTGRKLTEEEKRCRPSQSGTSNSNFKEFATTKFLLAMLYANSGEVVVEGYFIKSKFNIILKEEVQRMFSKKINASTIITNRFGTVAKFVAEFNMQYGITVNYNPYYRTLEHRKKLSEEIASFMWITNGIDNQRIKKIHTVPQEWRRGRTTC